MLHVKHIQLGYNVHSSQKDRSLGIDWHCLWTCRMPAKCFGAGDQMTIQS